MPGRRLVVRASARSPTSDAPQPLGIEDVRLAGERVPFETSGRDPTYVRVDVPAALAASDATIEVDVVAGERRDTLHREVALVDRSEGPPDVGRQALLDHFAAGRRVQVLPEARDLVSGVSNRLFFRARTASGVPMGGATLLVEHPSLPDGQARLATDAAGLASLRLRPDRPAYRLKMRLGEGDEAVAEEALVGVAGRKLLLRSDAVVFAPGTSLEAHLETWRVGAAPFCELVAGRAVVWAERPTLDRGEALLRLPPQAPGLYRLQCYEHGLEPGEAFATLPLLVDEGEPLEVLLAQVRIRDLGEAAHPSVPEGADPALASAFWQAALWKPIVPPTTWLDTATADARALQEAAEQRTTRMLAAVGVLILLFLLWLVDGVLKTTIETRERLRSLEPVPGDLAPSSLLDAPAPSGLLRARGLLLLSAGVVVIGLNVLAAIWLISEAW